ncbi:MAG: hypothetical protein WKG07_13650 [Hymenobacter sp.]
MISLFYGEGDLKENDKNWGAGRLGIRITHRYLGGLLGFMMGKEGIEKSL